MTNWAQMYVKHISEFRGLWIKISRKFYVLPLTLFLFMCSSLEGGFNDRCATPVIIILSKRYTSWNEITVFTNLLLQKINHPHWRSSRRYIADDHMIITGSWGDTDPAISPSWLWNPSDLSSLNFDLRRHTNGDTIFSLSFLPQPHRPLPPKIFTETWSMELQPLTPEQKSMCAFFWSRHVHVRWSWQLNVFFCFF